MKIDEYRELTDRQLNGKLKELNIMIIQSYSFMEKSKVKREIRPNLRKEIARIKTIIKEREMAQNEKQSTE